MREGSVLPVSRFAKWGPVTALAILAVAVALVAVGTLGSGIATAPRLLMLGVGVLLLFFGVSMNAAKVVRPLAGLLGAPARTVGGAPGILARDNATRNPSRTASTASALMIGLALVTFVAIFGQGVRKSFEGAVNQLFIADYTVTATNTFTPRFTTPQNAGGLAWDPGKKVLWVGLGGGLVVPYHLNGTPYNAGFRPFGPIADTIDGLEFVRKIHHHGKHHNDH